jgi:Lrp/AsnC family transcriptional regulator, regulator for asnA, asnC and gidA
MTKIDTIDREIVCLLQKNGRMEYQEIASHLNGVSARVVRYRVARLVELGVIRPGAIVNSDAIGFPVKADIWIEVEPGRAMEIAEIMAGFEQVTYVACSTGDVDISIQVRARDNADMYCFVTDEVGRVAGVKKTTIRLVPFIIKDIHDWQIPTSACR